MTRFLRPQPGPPLRRRDQSLLDRARPLHVQIGGAELAVFEWGEGPVVALAHGWASRAAHLAAFVEPLCEVGYRVVAADMPGHGESPGDLSDLYQFRLALHAVAKSVGPLSAVVAHSGGVLATIMAMTEGLSADRVVALAAMVRLETAAHGHGPLYGADENAQTDFLRLMVERYGPDLWERTDGVRVAASLDVPALLLHDPDDADTPYSEAVELAEVWRGARLLPVPELGHRRILRHPSTVAAALDFLG